MATINSSSLKDIFALRLYSRVARLGSFSAAARECGLSQPQVSRIVADLEADLGRRLLTRTTRAVVPTEGGSEFLARIEPILAALDEAEYSIREGGELRGVVRLSMPTSVGVREVIPRLASFTAKHPRLRMHFLLEDRRQDLVRDAVDVAIRLGRQSDSSATARLMTTVPRVIAASPVYLERYGVPETPGDLSAHRIVGGPASAVPSAWTFERDGEKLSVDLQPHFSTNENSGAVAAATAGIGITSTTLWACRRELTDGSLIRLFPEWKTVDIPVYAYFPMGRATRAAGRAVIEYLAADFRREDSQN
ncbi:LysR family transcriptional regulator [Solimonas sp. K1W22B-7]|uniref:LysR family transcriptional regulator n=1 Tax=Solimonas sp. K1W22B-7 TaxID=2303331 RepID=UPI000E32DF50|nr:LysR family transcriptional regulator [Solimonas sp. K1W22B-7]